MANTAQIIQFTEASKRQAVIRKKKAAEKCKQALKEMHDKGYDLMGMVGQNRDIMLDLAETIVTLVEAIEQFESAKDERDKGPQHETAY